MAVLGRKLRETADVLQQQIKNLKAVAEVTAWDSDAGKEFRKTAEGTVGKLEAAFKRYDAAADALGTQVGDENTRNYASQLHRAQLKADAALKDAQEADGRKSAAQKSLDDLKSSKDSKDDDKSKKKGFESSLDAADSDIQAARDRIDSAKTIRDEAAKAAQDSIENIIDHDSLKDKESFWGSLLETINEWAGTISAVCGILSMLVGWIPIIGQALAGVLGAIAMIASLVSLVCTIIQVFRGEADLWDLGFAVLGFAMLGVGKAFGKIAGKFAGKAIPRLSRASGRTKAGKVIKRDRQKLNRIANQEGKLSRQDIKDAFKEPFKEVFTKEGWKGTGQNLRTLVSPSKYGEAGAAMSRSGGAARSISLVDSSVANQLKTAKQLAKDMGDGLPAINKISRKANVLSGVGVGLTAANFLNDDTAREWAGIPDWKEKLKSTTE